MFPLIPLSRAVSIGSVHTPRSALWRCHRSSCACLSLAGTREDVSSRFMASAFPPSCRPLLHRWLAGFVPWFPVFPALDFPWLACATMAALTSAGHPAVSRPGSSPAFTPTPLPDILSPTTPTSPPSANALFRRRSLLFTSRLRQSLAGSPVCCGRIVFICFVFLTVCQGLLVAPSIRTQLPTPPRGDAVTSGSQPGCVRSWLESPTPEGVGALRRTSAVLPGGGVTRAHDP